MNAPVTPLEFFRASGIPHRRMEDWKYTDLRSSLDVASIERQEQVTIKVTADKHVDSLKSITAAVPERFLSHLGRFPYSEKSAMNAAAKAFSSEATLLRVPRGTKLEKPIRIEHSGSGHGHVFLLIEPEAQAVLLEDHQPNADDLRNVSFSIVLQSGAKLTHIRKAPFMPDAISVETVSMILEDRTEYRAHLLLAGAKLSRSEFNIHLNRWAAVDFSGIAVLGDGAHTDITTRFDHAEPDTTSRQLIKYVLGGKSRAVYQGKIKVEENGVDSRQTAKALLLSDRAEADLKPELEILADDVKCAHGAAVGELDQDSLFYLRSRGIPEAEARALLIHAFLQEVVDGIENKDIQEAAAQFIERGLVQAMRGTS